MKMQDMHLEDLMEVRAALSTLRAYRRRLMDRKFARKNEFWFGRLNVDTQLTLFQHNVNEVELALKKLTNAEKTYKHMQELKNENRDKRAGRNTLRPRLNR